VPVNTVERRFHRFIIPIISHVLVTRVFKRGIPLFYINRISGVSPVAKKQLFERYSLDSLEQGNVVDPKGNIFASPRKFFDLSNVDFLLASIDTIRQNYKGTVKTRYLEIFEQAIEEKNSIIGGAGYLQGKEWHFARMPKSSGYMYKLQNNEIGVVVLCKSYYADADQSHNHLKIELSPKNIAERGTKQIQQQLDMIAQTLLDSPLPCGVAIHLALDVQGWELPEDFVERFTTRARTVMQYDGFKNVSIDDLSTVSASYGKKETITFGKATALQISIYDKTKEIIHSDKQDFFFDRWCFHDTSKPVYRIEARFHQHVIRECGLYQNETFEAFQDVEPYLTDLWRYALDSNYLRLSKGDFIDPYWQKFQEDTVFLHPSSGLFFRRMKKQSQGNTGRNYAQIIGNIITVAARLGFSPQQVMSQLKKLDFYDQIVEYYRHSGRTESDLREQVIKGLNLRRLIGKAT